ncbi:MAG TPA: hypothetical protein VGL60_01705 [Acidimicrobiales bacterium]
MLDETVTIVASGWVWRCSMNAAMNRIGAQKVGRDHRLGRIEERRRPVPVLDPHDASYGQPRR